MGIPSVPKPKIILIIVDALRARNLSCYGYDKATTPVLGSIAQDGALFQNCFSTTNITGPSVTTIFSGKYPASHGLVEQAVTTENIYKRSLQNLLCYRQS